jgi:tRNA A-37 threonylcarbamoyl transferase component Bud32
MTPRQPKRRPAGGNGAGEMLADRYRLEKRIAAGGMGEVWRATDTLLERVVAVKLLRDSLAEDPIVSERFRREALMAAQISHPNMAGVFDYVQEHDRPGIVMEFVDGETLAERLTREGRLPVGDAVRITSALLAALGSAHDMGIVHRDVKPGNVMLTSNGDVKVTDFGIARAASDHTLTETGTVVGTAHYLAPEQVGGAQATPASDLYSVGAILYEMLGGRRPFEAATPIAVAMKRLTEDPPPIRDLRADVPEPVATVIDRALAREPGDRFASAAEMRRALDEGYAGVQPATLPQRIDPTPTMVLPVADVAGAATTAAVRPAVSDETGQGSMALVSERRKRGYKRLIGYAVLLAVGIAVATLLFLALTGNGQSIVVTPNFRGSTIQQARAKAADLGLKINEVPRDSTLPAGKVTGQSIPASTPVGSGTEITLGVSTGNAPAPAQILVPDVVGKDREEAEDVLKQAGFTVKVSEAATDSVDVGEVIGQDPSADDMAPAGSEVTIVVATAPKRRGKGKGGN